jgi:hypothetical protein
MTDDIWTPFTAENLIRYYHDLSVQEQRVFHDLFLPVLRPKAGGMMRLLRAMPEDERFRFFQEVCATHIFPWLRQLADKHAPIAIQNHYIPQLQEILKDQKQKRDRKHDPEIVRRNVEICDRRKEDPKAWSLKKLAAKYKISIRNITLILLDEAKWRQLDQNRK